MCRSASHHHHRRSAVAERHIRPVDAGRPDLRVSDADRERTAALLREHAAQGRLTVEELEERSERALAARTRADLRALHTDLPDIRLPADRRARALRQRDEARDHLRSYLGVMVLLVVIWAATGGGYFWPMWPALGWGIGVASHVLPVYRRRQRRLAA